MRVGKATVRGSCPSPVLVLPRALGGVAAEAYALVVGALPISLAWQSVHRWRWHVLHVYIHERLVRVLTNAHPHSFVEQFRPWSCRRALLMANGSLHTMHFLRSFSAMSSSVVSYPCVGALTPALSLTSVRSSLFYGRLVFQTLFARDCPSPAYTVRARRTLPHCLRRCLADVRASIWHCAPHSGQCLILSVGPGFFASPILHCCISFHRRFSNHHVIEDSHRT